MFFRPLLGVLGIAAVSVLAMSACSEDACTNAGDHLAECLGGEQDGSSPDSGSSSASVACDDLVKCVADCVNDAKCDELQDAFAETPTELSDNYRKCVEDCSAVP